MPCPYCLFKIDMITIDGSEGEGGGQILRTSLGLSLVTAKPFYIKNIRVKRKKPGLLPQHLTAVRAAQEISSAKVEGAFLGSKELSFTPSHVNGGHYCFNVGTAGSTTLVLETILPSLLVSQKSFSLILEGGTHNPFAPPFDFLERVFFCILKAMGAHFDLKLICPGFYPAGGGRMEYTIEPQPLQGIEILERGDPLKKTARAVVAKLNPNIGKRELAVIKSEMNFHDGELILEEIKETKGPGNVVMMEIQSQKITEVFTSFGELGKPAEKVAKEVCLEAQKYLEAQVPVGPYLADQLLIPFALVGKGAFKTMALTQHTQTNLETIKKFLEVKIKQERIKKDEVVLLFG